MTRHHITGTLLLPLLTTSIIGCASSFDGGTPVRMSCGELARRWSYVNAFTGNSFGTESEWSLFAPRLGAFDSVRGLSIVQSSDPPSLRRDSIYMEFDHGWLSTLSQYHVRDDTTYTIEHRWTYSWRYDSLNCRILVDKLNSHFPKELRQTYDTIRIDAAEATFQLKEGRWKQRTRLGEREGRLIFSFDVPWMDWEGASTFDSTMRFVSNTTFMEGDLRSFSATTGDLHVSGYEERFDDCTIIEPHLSVSHSTSGAIESIDYYSDDLDDLLQTMLDQRERFDIRIVADSIRAREPESFYGRSMIRYEWIYR